MKSIAIFYKSEKKDEKNTQCKNELHLNIWKVYRGKISLKPVYYLDFGLKVKFEMNKICIYVPFEIEHDDKVDKGKLIMDNRSLLGAIFNDDMLPEPCLNPCFCKVSYNNCEQGDKGPFYLYQLGDNNIKFESFKSENGVGTYIKISIDGCPEKNISEFVDEKVYIRFRVMVKDEKQFVITEHISNDLIQAAFSMTDLFDLRFNETREIDGKILEKMRTDEYLQMVFGKIHVFYIADTREDVINGSSIKIDSRLLEENHWCNYEPDNSLKHTHYIAHHWKKAEKEKQPIRNASIFFSTKYPKIDKWRLFAYFGVIVFLGWLGSMLSFAPMQLPHNLWDTIKGTVVLILVLWVIFFVIKVNYEYSSFKFLRKR